MSTVTESAESFCRLLVEGFIRFPTEFEVKVSEVNDLLIFILTPHADDMGKIIGSKSIMFNALQTLLIEYSKGIGRRVQFIVEEPVVGTVFEKPPFVNDPQWPRERILNLFELICRNLFRKFTFTDASVGFETSIIVLSSDVSEEVVSALSRIMNAVGKANGRKLFVERKHHDDRRTDKRRTSQIPC